MKLVILDRKTLGNDVDISIFEKFGEVVSYDITKENETLDRIKDADIVLTNKVYVGENELKDSSVKLICITATGMNNVDLDYAKANNMAVVKFVRFEVGEGMEKRNDDFASEVMSQING